MARLNTAIRCASEHEMAPAELGHGMNMVSAT